MGFNYYGFLLWLLLSPWGMAFIILTVMVFLYSYWQIMRLEKIKDRFKRAPDYATTREYIVYYDDNHGPMPMRVKDRSEMWFVILLMAGLTLIGFIGIPTTCAFTYVGQTWVCS